MRHFIMLKVLSNGERGAETGINRSILISWFVGKCSFLALKGHHHTITFCGIVGKEV
jgi:hypothetical protein